MTVGNADNKMPKKSKTVKKQTVSTAGEQGVEVMSHLENDKTTPASSKSNTSYVLFICSFSLGFAFRHTRAYFMCKCS